MLFSANKSIPIWILLAIVFHNGWHLKGIYKYQIHERPKDRWDFKVWQLPTLVRTSSLESLVKQHVTAVNVALFTTRRQLSNQTNPSYAASIETFNEYGNETSHVAAAINNEKESDDAPYIYKNHLHQPFSKKNSPWKIFFHVICGSVPIFTGAANLLDFMRTTKTGTTTRSHRVMGNLFFVFGLITAISGTVLAPNMLFSHYRPILCTCVALLGVATTACILFSIEFLRTAIRIRKNDINTGNNKQMILLYNANILGHRVWVLRGWLLMEFFLLWARALMGINFLLTGHKYSFMIGGITALITVPFLLEWVVWWHLTRTNEGYKYRILGPLPWTSKDDLLRLETASSMSVVTEFFTDQKKID